MTDFRMIAGRALHPGIAEGPILLLDAPISFWGGVDPRSGRIVDHAHPQQGQLMTGSVLAMSGSRGSSGTPGVLGEMLRLGTGPVAILLTKPDVNIVAGALVAEELYGSVCPILQIEHDTFETLQNGTNVRIGHQD